MSTDHQTLRTQLSSNGVFSVTLNRPRQLNAINSQMLVEIAAVFSALPAGTRVVVLEGAGRAFCAGADRRHPPGISPKSASRKAQLTKASEGFRAIAAIRAAAVPTIAKVHGHVIGGGGLLALACDFRIAATDTSFRLPEVELGIPLPWGGVPLLVQELGARTARKLIYFGTAIDAQNGQRLGLYDLVCEPCELASESLQLASKLIAQPETALNMTKQQFSHWFSSAAAAELRDFDAQLYLAAMPENWAPLD